MKYIMFQHGDHKVPVIFPESLNHSDVAAGFERTLAHSKMRPVSAGQITALGVLGTTGESTTTGLKASEEDARIINAYPYNYGLDCGTDESVEALILTKLAFDIADRYDK